MRHRRHPSGLFVQSYFLADNKSDAIYQVSNIYTTSCSLFSSTNLQILPSFIIKYNKHFIHCYNTLFNTWPIPLHPFFPILPILPIDRLTKKSREGVLDKRRKKKKKGKKKERRSYLGKGRNRFRPPSKRPVILLVHIYFPYLNYPWAPHQIEKAYTKENTASKTKTKTKTKKSRHSTREFTILIIYTVADSIWY